MILDSLFVYDIVLMLDIPVNNFSVCWGVYLSSWVGGQWLSGRVLDSPDRGAAGS